MRRNLEVLLINPYIYDVSAYGFWSAPLGLLYVGAILRESGMRLSLLDCLSEQEKKRKMDGRAPFRKDRVDNPERLKDLPKRFKRYGMSPEAVLCRLKDRERPDLVLVTCAMTYWYAGAAELVGIVRDVFPSSRIVVGGTYPALCEEHAKRQMTKADLVVGVNDLDRFYELCEDLAGRRLAHTPGRDEISKFPYPAFDLYERRPFVPLLTSIGCLYRCGYCATPYLRSTIARRGTKSVLEEIRCWNEKGLSRFVLYDDAFLTGAEAFAKPLLGGIGRFSFDVTFYNPNALNAALLDAETARLLKSARFAEVRLGLETIDPAIQRATGGKVSRRAFEKAVTYLLGAGFQGNTIHAYVLAGLPLQKWEGVKKTVDYAASLGIKVDLAQYTPIPHTVMFDQYSRLSRYPIVEEPLFQNNALFPFAWEGFTDSDMDHMKGYVREKNSQSGAVAGGDAPE